MNNYKTIEKIGTSKKMFKNSVFIGYASPITSEKEAKNFINNVKNHHNDANHNVYAYVVENSLKYDDDGEPSGSAGKPIMNMLECKKLTNIVVVVSRYFGGVKLGYGGLVKAYSETAKEAIENGKIIEKYEMECIVMELPYTMLNITRKILLEKNAKIIKEDYADNVIITVNLKKDSIKTVIDKLTNATKGRIKIQILDCNNQTP